MPQRVLEKPLEKNAGRNYGPPGNKAMFNFIDDMNMPMVDNYGTKQAHTIIRQFIDYQDWYDRANLLKEIHNCQFDASMNPTAGSFNELWHEKDDEIKDNIQRFEDGQTKVAEHIQIFVVTLDRVIVLKVDVFSTIYLVKKLIRNHERVAVDKQMLIFSGNHLIDEMTLQELSIQNKCTIHMAMRLTGGAPDAGN
jgi:hypothetical protein